MRIWLWRPKWRWTTTLNAKRKIWLWTLNEKWSTALNAKPKMQWWLWTPKLRSDEDGSKRRNWKWDSERQTENAMMALNAKTKKQWSLWMSKLRNYGGSECRSWEAMVARNTETEKRWWLWTLERETNDDSKHQTEDVALNAKLKMWNETDSMSLEKYSASKSKWSNRLYTWPHNLSD